MGPATDVLKSSLNNFDKRKDFQSTGKERVGEKGKGGGGERDIEDKNLLDFSLYWRQLQLCKEPPNFQDLSI